MPAGIKRKYAIRQSRIVHLRRVKMKKKAWISILALFLFAAMAQSCEIETNYDEIEGHYGKLVIHNDTDSGSTIDRILIETGALLYFYDQYDETVYITPGASSEKIEIKLSLVTFSHELTRQRVSVTADGSTKSTIIMVYEDVVANLYWDGTDLVERK
jgi:hypothetical protein